MNGVTYVSKDSISFNFKKRCLKGNTAGIDEIVSNLEKAD